MTWERGDAWEAPGGFVVGRFDIPRTSWWAQVLETDFASTEEIDYACGPMYRMYQEATGL